MRRRFGVIVAVALTLVGTLILVSYVNGADARAQAGEKLVDVLVVAQPVAKGTPASQLDGKVKIERVPARLRSAASITQLSALHGLVTNADLVAGEQVVRARFAKPDALDVAGAIDTTKLVKVSASLDAERAVGGQLKPGDSVVVTISQEQDKVKVTRVRIHQVPVVGVIGGVVSSSDDKKKSDAGASKSSSTNSQVMVTLGLTEAQAGELIWGLEHATVWLALEPANADQSNTNTVDGSGIFR